MSVLVAGCGTPPPDTTPAKPAVPHYSSGAQVSEALQKARLDCRDYAVTEHGGRGVGEEDAVEVGSCTVRNETVSILLWKRASQQKDWAELNTFLGCEFASALDRPVPVYVDGGSWTVVPKSRTLATPIAQSIGGRVVQADCRAMH